MKITPQLPPKKGYVEIIDAEGNHVYKATSRQEKIDLIRNKIINIDVACIPETEEGVTSVDTAEVIINKLDYIADLLNSILDVL